VLFGNRQNFYSGCPSVQRSFLKGQNVKLKKKLKNADFERNTHLTSLTKRRKYEIETETNLPNFYSSSSFASIKKIEIFISRCFERWVDKSVMGWLNELIPPKLSELSFSAQKPRGWFIMQLMPSYLTNFLLFLQ